MSKADSLRHGFPLLFVVRVGVVGTGRGCLTSPDVLSGKIGPTSCLPLMSDFGPRFAPTAVIF